MPLIPDLDGTIIRSADDQWRSASCRIARVHVTRVTFQTFNAFARRNVEYADRFVGGRGVDVVTVGRELQVDDGAAVGRVEDVEVVAFAVHVPQD